MELETNKMGELPPKFWGKVLLNREFYDQFLKCEEWIKTFLDIQGLHFFFSYALSTKKPAKDIIRR